MRKARLPAPQPSSPRPRCRCSLRSSRCVAGRRIRHGTSARGRRRRPPVVLPPHRPLLNLKPLRCRHSDRKRASRKRSSRTHRSRASKGSCAVRSRGRSRCRVHDMRLLQVVALALSDVHEAVRTLVATRARRRRSRRRPRHRRPRHRRPRHRHPRNRRPLHRLPRHRHPRLRHPRH